MTKREAAGSVICVGNLCSNGCPMFRSCDFKCLAKETADAELIKIARKEYARKSRDAKTGKEYRQMMANEWKMIGGAKVV